MSKLDWHGFHSEILPVYTKALCVALGYRDQSTQMHSARVLGIAEEIGLCCDFSQKDLEILCISSFFHDIGIIGIPDLLLKKPARLNADQFSQMQEHSEIGQDILNSMQIEGCIEAGTAIRHHHEYFGGHGYPDGLAHEEIPVCSRIISIADNYDAMAMPRPYTKSRTHREIMEIMYSETGIKHDPYLMNIFSEIIEKIPFKAAPQ